MSHDLPAVVHPNPVIVNGFRFQVQSHYPLTEQEAELIALHAYRCRKWSKRDMDKIHVQYWIGQRQDFMRIQPGHRVAH